MAYVEPESTATLHCPSAGGDIPLFQRNGRLEVEVQLLHGVHPMQVSEGQDHTTWASLILLSDLFPKLWSDWKWSSSILVQPHELRTFARTVFK